MNHAYRVLWSDSRRAHVAVPETARANGKGGKGGKGGGGGLRARCLIALLASLGAGQLLAAPPPATALPEGGRVTAGAAGISQSGARMDVTQTSERAVLEWTRFDIGSQAQVNFAQPSASSVALNRVLAGEASQIYGRLTANGQVWLINPAGVMFGPGSRVDVGGLVASTLDTLDADFLAGNAKFQRNGATGKIVNQGEITAADGGLLALLAPEVRNEGVITARLGNVVLAAGERVTLDAGADGFLKIAVDPATVSTLVDNRHLIQADGGQVLMSAQAADRLLSAVVANSGTVQARTLEHRAGRILLLADMDHGEIRHDGLLDASVPTTPSPLAGEGATADGGFIETSAAKVGVGDTARVTTLAANGRTGTWLIDPNDYSIAASGGNITGAQLATNLGSTNVTISTATQGTAGGNGDIFVNDAVSWSADTTLSLQAERDIRINANVTATGNTAGLTLGHGAGRDYYLKGAKVTLSGSAPTLKIGTAGAEDTYIVINGLGVAGDTTTTTLQGMKNNMTGKYALGSDIDATATAGWNGSSGFEPVGSDYYTSHFVGTFSGLGHTIDRLAINRPSVDNVGLFGYTSGVHRDIGLTQVSVTGRHYVGGLVGTTYAGTVSDSYSSGSVSGVNSVGGLVGQGFAAGQGIRNSYAAGTVSGSTGVGGLVGTTLGTVVNSHYNIDQVTINGAHHVAIGGLYDTQYQDWFTHDRTLNIASYTSTLPLTAGYYTVSSLQGLKDILGFADVAGYKFSLAANLDLTSIPGWFIPYFSAQEFDGANYVLSNLNVNQSFGYDVGLIGAAHRTTLRNISAMDVQVSGYDRTGGVVGYLDNSEITNSRSTGIVTANSSVGGLVGQVYGSTVSNSSSANTVNGGASAGGLIGTMVIGWVSTSYSTGAVNGTNNSGGLIGTNGGTINNSYSTGAVNGTQNVGGLAGYNSGGTITNSYSTGAVNGSANVGGLVGQSYFLNSNRPGTASNSYWNTETSGKATSAGGTGVTTAQMKQQSGFSGWDFNGAWRIYEGQSYPVLRSLQKDLTVTANDAVRTYDGQAYSGSEGAVYSISGAPIIGTLIYGGTSQGAVNASSYTITPGGVSINHATQQSYQDWGDIIFNNGTLTINQKALTLTGFDAANKVYDGTTTAPIANAGNLSGVIGADVVTASIGGASFADKNVGTGKTVTLAGIALTGTDAGNYSIAATATDTADITAKALTLTGFDAASKVYDGNTTATIVNAGGLFGVIGADVVTASNAGATFADKNVGAGKTVTLAGIALGGAGAGNYSIAATTTDTADITAKALTLTGFDAAGKVYDGNTTATIANAGSLAGVIGADVVTVSNGGANFADRNVGAGKTVTLSGIALGGAGAGNYSIAATTTDTADITAKQLSVGGTTTVSDKTYDSTTAATVSGGTVSGVVGADAASLVQSGSFDTKDVGNGKTVTYANSLGGGDAGNYSLSSAGGTTVASITAKALSIAANNDSKTQNGTPYSGGNGVSYSGLVSGETAAVLAGSLAYGGTSQGASAIGSYVISPAGLSSTNYAITFADGVLSITAVPPAPTFTPGQPDGGQLGRMAAAEPGNGGSAAIVVLPAAGDTGSIANLSFGGNFIRLPGE